MPCAGGLGQVPRVAEAGGRLARGRGPQEPHSARLPFLQKHPAPQDLTSGRGVRLGGRSCAPFPTASPANNLQPAPPGRPRSNPARPTVQVCSLKARVSRLPAFKPRRDRTSHFQINTALKARSHFFKSPRSPGACKPSKSSPVWSSGQRSPAPRVARLGRAAGPGRHRRPRPSRVNRSPRPAPHGASAHPLGGGPRIPDADWLAAHGPAPGRARTVGRAGARGAAP